MSPDLSKVYACNAPFTADGRPPVLPQRGEQGRTSFGCRTSVDRPWPIARGKCEDSVQSARDGMCWQHFSPFVPQAFFDPQPFYDLES
jgi:hypothetical protein